MKTRDLAGTVTSDEFERAVGKLKPLKPENRQAAYLYLVEGKTYPEAQAMCGIKHRTQVHLLVSRILAVLGPRGWETAMITLPPELMAQVREMERQALQDYQDSNAGGAS